MPYTTTSLANRLAIVYGPVMPIDKGGTFNDEFSSGVVPYYDAAEDQLANSPIFFDGDDTINAYAIVKARAARVGGVLGEGGYAATTETTPTQMMVQGLHAGVFADEGYGADLVLLCQGVRDSGEPTHGYGYELYFDGQLISSDSSTLESNKWGFHIRFLRSDETDVVVMLNDTGSSLVVTPGDIDDAIYILFKGYAIGATGEMRLLAYRVERK